MDDDTDSAEELDDEPEVIEAADLSHDAFDEGYIVAVLMGDYIFAPDERRGAEPEGEVYTRRIVWTFLIIIVFIALLFFVAWLTS